MSLYENRRCKCKEEFLITKKRKSTNRSEGKPIQYPEPDFSEIKSKIFQIKYEKEFSLKAKLILNSFENKYLYYAIDDILYNFQSNPRERDSLLSILYSPVLSVHNNLSINLFDIWIHEIYINKVSKRNKFLENNSNNFEPFNYLTLKLLYKPKLEIKKQETLW
jgi:hypothetical protein